MKRGFLNSSQYKRAISTDTGPRLSSAKRTRGSGDGEGLAAIGDQNAMDVSDAGAGNSSDAIATDPNGKGKAKAVDTTNGAESKGKSAMETEMEKMLEEMGMNSDSHTYSQGPAIARVSPGRRGWGRHPDEHVLHTVPASHGGPGRKRCIFRAWPRDPNGKTIIQRDKPKGKVSPDGYPWGATLYDFFAVHRVPSIPNMESYMTGSALLKEMKAMGELDAAAPEIAWAESEGEPRDEGVADTEELVTCTENHIRVAALGGVTVQNFSGPDEGDDEKNEDEEHEENEEEEHRENEEENEEEDQGGYEEDIIDPGSIPPPPEIPVTSPFHPSRYSKPWPLVPFESDDYSLLLQDRVPMHLLPRKLYVHDPFNLLATRKIRFRDTQWGSRPDIVRTYNLALSESVRKKAAEERTKAEEVEEFKARTLVVLRYKRTREQVQNYEPVVEVPLPPYPRRLTSIKDAHLHISPVAKVGEGHHSVVYRGEWELPRDLYVRPSICASCFKESADKEIQRLKDTGRWAKMLRAASWGPKGYTGRKATKAELDAVNDPIDLARDGEIIEREIICLVPANAPPSQILRLLDEKQIWKACMERKNKNTVILNFATGEGESTSDSGVAIMRIDPPFSYESQKDCRHKAPFFGGGAIPPTTKFTVTAKLSLEHDTHLATEARNYQQFPDHFFRHYDGYTIIPQLHAIVPVHAIVPQFYGYYKPSVEKKDDQPYLSPILLLEHCGQPIDPETLSSEDQEECISMILRFQQSGWLHESVFPRNFLVQRGPPTEFPLSRMAHPELSFRMIDFGRSRKWTRAEEKRGEEMEALGMFEKLFGRMAVTLG